MPKLEKLIVDADNILTYSKNWEPDSPNEIRIGISPVVNMLHLQVLIAPFKESHPQVEFYYQECYLDDLEDLLKNDALDVIIMPPRPTDFATDRAALYSEPLFYVPVQEQSQDTEFYQLKEIAQHKLILTIDVCGLRDVTIDLFKNHNIQLNQYQGAATSYVVVK